jgi:hypothetical protein
MNDVSFNSLLQQALTFGAKRITPSRLPQFIGFVVYAGLIGAVWTGFSLKLDQRVVIAGIVLLLIAAIMTILLLLGATIYPIVLNILVIIVVVGFLTIGGYAVVKIASPDVPIELHLQATLQYADHPSAGRFSVGIAGNQPAVETSSNGYFDLTITPEDINDGKVNLHIESPDHRYAEDQKISVRSTGTTRTTVVLRMASPAPVAADVQTAVDPTEDALEKLRELHKVSVITPDFEDKPPSDVPKYSYGFAWAWSLTQKPLEPLTLIHSREVMEGNGLVEIHKLGDGRLEVVGFVGPETFARYRRGLKSGESITIYSVGWKDGHDVVSVPLNSLVCPTTRSAADGEALDCTIR